MGAFMQQLIFILVAGAVIAIVLTGVRKTDRRKRGATGDSGSMPGDSGGFDCDAGDAGGGDGGGGD